jgi:hypothetical protein
MLDVMMDTLSTDDLRFDSPAVYRIRARGRITARWSDRLEGMTITVDTPVAGSAVTTLVGQLEDQASLVGVLNTLYELHMPVQSVEHLSSG